MFSELFALLQITKLTSNENTKLKCSNIKINRYSNYANLHISSVPSILNFNY